MRLVELTEGVFAITVDSDSVSEELEPGLRVSLDLAAEFEAGTSADL